MNKCLVCGKQAETTYGGVVVCEGCYKNGGLLKYLKTNTFVGAEDEETGELFILLIENSMVPLKWEPNDVGKDIKVETIVVLFENLPVTIALVYDDYIHYMDGWYEVYEYVQEPPEVADPDVRFDGVSEQ